MKESLFKDGLDDDDLEANKIHSAIDKQCLLSVSRDSRRVACRQAILSTDTSFFLALVERGCGKAERCVVV